MKTITTIIFILFSFSVISAQTIERVEINGRITVDVPDKEGITVYNRSSNKGTTTDENGSFKIDVAENDVVAFGALQFKDFTIRIDERIIESRQVSVRLVEDVNKLDEVIVLPYDLSGNLKVDANAVKTVNVDMDKVYEDETDLDDYKFSADNKTKVDNPLVDPNRLVNGLNIVNVFKAIFPGKKNKPKTEAERLELNQSPITKKYTAQFLEENFNIPLNQTDAFIEFIQDKGYDEKLLKEKNEIYLIEYLEKQSQLFLLSKN
ncbi:carboxypeptidase-like regulatory domain-containing protein [Winogradskyella litorisediminis]|uniref:Carboxypeptidase-like regulatory domain-containing protein n=1 Tax=Winogradskyella litorisediminis TaxID=1156618 RepID=A0ABW3N6D2_9FLAO